MKVNISKPEETFASLNTGMSTFVFNIFQEYEAKIELLVEEIKKLREENSKLTKELERKECAENCKS